MSLPFKAGAGAPDGVDTARGLGSLPLAFLSGPRSGLPLTSDLAVVLDKARVGVGGILFLFGESSVSLLSSSYDEDTLKSEFKRECKGLLGVVAEQESRGLEK